MDLLEFQIKHLLQKEIEVIFEKEFSFTIDCCVRGKFQIILGSSRPINLNNH